MSSSNAARMLKIIRFHIVTGGLLAFLLGGLLAFANGGNFNPILFALVYTAGLLGDLSSHYSNDYFDVDVDKHMNQKKFFAGHAILVGYPNLRESSKSVSVSLLVCANVLAVALFLFLGAPIEIFIVILAASLAGWFYSAPPLRLTSRGLGEATIACVTGFAIPGLGYLSVRGQFDPLFVSFAFPFVMYGLVLSLSLEAPDEETDRKGGKKNLIVRKGARNVFLLILALTTASTLTFLAYSWLLVPTVLDVRALMLFSIVPLTAALISFIGVIKKKSVSRFSAVNVVSLFVFNMLTLAYLLAVVSTVQ